MRKSFKRNGRALSPLNVVCRSLLQKILSATGTRCLVAIVAVVVFTTDNLFQTMVDQVIRNTDLMKAMLTLRIAGPSNLLTNLISVQANGTTVAHNFGGTTILIIILVHRQLYGESAQRMARLDICCFTKVLLLKRLLYTPEGHIQRGTKQIKKMRSKEIRFDTSRVSPIQSIQ
jgi:hypothetical protein